jgi:membrane protease YdiL (CAAX protease family)
VAIIAPTLAVVGALVAVALGIRFGGAAAAAQRAWALSRIPVVRWLGSLAGALGRIAARISIDQWRAIDAELARERDAADAADGADAADAADAARPMVLLVLATVAASLTLQDYLGDHRAYDLWFPPSGSRYDELYYYLWWAGWRVGGYVVLPILVLAALPGQRLRDYHLALRGFVTHLWIYAALFALVAPAVLYTSTLESFRDTYPFYRLANRSYTDLVLWELLYGAQFVALEFFFRGFILHGLRRALGSHAIFVMLVPYCMIHFGKPMPETLGAIGAGLVLGTLAMRTRSIWGGVAIHIAVAVTMDILALRGCPALGGAPCRLIP